MFSDGTREDWRAINSVWSINWRSQYVSLVIVFHVNNNTSFKRESVHFIHFVTKGMSSEATFLRPATPTGAVLKMSVSGIFENTVDNKYKASPCAKETNSKRTKAWVKATRFQLIKFLHPCIEYTVRV